jgi:hypothetical protein
MEQNSISFGNEAFWTHFTMGINAEANSFEVRGPEVGIFVLLELFRKRIQ